MGGVITANKCNSKSSIETASHNGGGREMFSRKPSNATKQNQGTVKYLTDISDRRDSCSSSNGKDSQSGCSGVSADQSEANSVGSDVNCDNKENAAHLSPRQVKLLLTSWKVIRNNMQDIGQQIFIRMFVVHPSMRSLFGYDDGTTEADLHVDDELRSHGLRIMRTIDTLLNSIFTTCDLECDEGTQMLSRLGRKHLTFKAKPEYFKMMGPLFVDVIEPMHPKPYTTEDRRAWLDLFSYIAYIMGSSMTASPTATGPAPSTNKTEEKSVT